jgi:hypothetical protein
MIGMLGILAILPGCLKPPLALMQKGNGIEVSVATLGEYPTSISRIQLKDSDQGKIIWELRSKGRVPQLWGFHLSPGVNPSEPSGILHAQYEVVAPSGNRSFMLKKGRRYEISVWNKEGTRREIASFTL